MKPLFDAIRKLLGRPLRQSEVDAINASMKPDAPSEPERNMTPGQIGAEGVALIKAFEGCHRKRGDGMIQAYPDPGTGGLPHTIGWGSTKGLDGKPFSLKYIITQAEADWLLERDLGKYADEVKTALGSALPATSHAQFDALVSFHYNTGAIARATLTRLHKAGLYSEAAAEFGKWVNAGGRPMKGLIRRRDAEKKLYLAGAK